MKFVVERIESNGTATALFWNTDGDWSHRYCLRKTQQTGQKHQLREKTLADQDVPRLGATVKIASS